MDAARDFEGREGEAFYDTLTPYTALPLRELRRYLKEPAFQLFLNAFLIAVLCHTCRRPPATGKRDHLK